MGDTGMIIFLVVLAIAFIWSLTKLRLSTFLYILSFTTASSGVKLTGWNDGLGTLITIAGVVIGVLAFLRGRAEKRKAAVAQAAANK
jgi:hypothetical protein